MKTYCDKCDGLIDDGDSIPWGHVLLSFLTFGVWLAVLILFGIIDSTVPERKCNCNH